MDKIIGIGNALVDVLVRLDDEKILSQLGLPKGGMVLIDDERQQSLSQRIGALNPARATGGSAGNAMLALANLGRRPGFVGCVAGDETGRFFEDNCRQTGIDARLIHGEGHSGVANTFITPDAERTFATYLGVAGQLRPEDITEELFRGCQLLHIEGYLVQDHDLILRICQTAKRLGMQTSIDLASYNVVRDNLPLLRTLVRDYIDIVFANEEESLAFTGKTDPAEALQDIAGMARVSVVKLGARGALAMTGGESSYWPGQSEHVVDTTAAGDFFAGGFLHALTLGGTLAQCLEMGSLLAGNVIQVIGTRLPASQWEQIRQKTKEILTSKP